MEAHDIEFAVEGVDECADLRGRLRAGPQQCMHGLGADAAVAVVEGCFSQGGPDRGEHPPKLLGKVAQAAATRTRTYGSASCNRDRRLGTAASGGELPTRDALACGRSKGLS
ncbi:MAG TPA: hypothetical protein VKE74_16820 [Gemmataceae bacterium]|nr:hypothetical protein [Gemmataceae bacterium]